MRGPAAASRVSANATRLPTTQHMSGVHESPYREGSSHATPSTWHRSRSNLTSCTHDRQLCKFSEDTPLRI